MGVGAVGAMGIHHSHSFGQGVLALVVISDHQIDPQFFTELGLFHGGDTAVHGDDQLDAFCVKLVNGDGV